MGSGTIMYERPSSGPWPAAVRHRTTLIYDEFYWGQGEQGQVKRISSAGFPIPPSDRPPLHYDCPHGARGDDQACNLSWTIAWMPEMSLRYVDLVHLLLYFSALPASLRTGRAELGDSGDILPIKWWVVSPAGDCGVFSPVRWLLRPFNNEFLYIPSSIPSSNFPSPS